MSCKFILRMIDDEHYTGRRIPDDRYSGTGRDEVIENDHEAIIDSELFARVQELRCLSRQKKAKLFPDARAEREAEHGKEGNGTATDDQP